jgi:hypothetical protein
VIDEEALYLGLAPAIRALVGLDVKLFIPTQESGDGTYRSGKRHRNENGSGLARKIAFTEFGIKNTEFLRQAYAPHFNRGESPILKSTEIIAREPDVTLSISLLFFIFLIVPFIEERAVS